MIESAKWPDKFIQASNWLNTEFLTIEVDNERITKDAFVKVDSVKRWVFANGKCMTVSHTERLHVLQKKCGSDDTQKWLVDREGHITSVLYPGFCLDYHTPFLGFRTLQLWPCDGSKSQEWILRRERENIPFPKDFFAAADQRKKNSLVTTRRSPVENFLAVQFGRADIRDASMNGQTGRDEKEQTALDVAKSLTNVDMYAIFGKAVAKNYRAHALVLVIAISMIISVFTNPVSVVGYLSFPLIMNKKLHQQILLLGLLIAFVPYIPGDVLRAMISSLRSITVLSTVTNSLVAVFEAYAATKVGKKVQVIEAGLKRRLQKRSLETIELSSDFIEKPFKLNDHQKEAFKNASQKCLLVASRNAWRLNKIAKGEIVDVGDFEFCDGIFDEIRTY